MSSKRKRYWSPGHAEALLNAIGECRRACIKSHEHAQINGPIYTRASEVMNAIDDLAGELTGDRQHFWIKMAPASAQR